MGHNVVSSSLIGSIKEKKNTTDANYVPEDTQTSFFNIHEGTVDHEFVNGLNPYEGRKVGVSKKQQERAEELQSL